MVLGCKVIHKPGRTFSGFSWIFIKFAGPKSNLHPRMEISSLASLTPKLSIPCRLCKFPEIVGKEGTIRAVRHIEGLNGKLLTAKSY